MYIIDQLPPLFPLPETFFTFFSTLTFHISAQTSFSRKSFSTPRHNRFLLLYALREDMSFKTLNILDPQLFEEYLISLLDCKIHEDRNHIGFCSLLCPKYQTNAWLRTTFCSDSINVPLKSCLPGTLEYIKMRSYWIRLAPNPMMVSSHRPGV